MEIAATFVFYMGFSISGFGFGGFEYKDVLYDAGLYGVDVLIGAFVCFFLCLNIYGMA